MVVVDDDDDNAESVILLYCTGRERERKQTTRVVAMRTLGNVVHTNKKKIRTSKDHNITNKLNHAIIDISKKNVESQLSTRVLILKF